MEKRCSICGKDFIEFGNNAEPIRKGICCDSCNKKFVIPGRILESSSNSEAVMSFEVAKNRKQLMSLQEKLREKNFEKIKDFPFISVYENPESEERVLICII